MNLHSIASGYVSSVNPMLVATWQQSNGTQTTPDGRQVPFYVSIPGVKVQLQAMTYRDLVQLEGLNINGIAQAIYVNGNVMGASRPDARGGDLFILSDGSVWLVTHVLENFNLSAGWTKACVIKQNGS